MIRASVAAFLLTLYAGAEEPKTPVPPDEPVFTQDFGEAVEDFVTTGKNPYFILEPGYVLEYEGTEGKTKLKLAITVLDETKKVDGIKTRIVEEKEWEGDELIEVSRNYFAISKRTNAVYYFGEDVDMYKGGKVVSHDGSWLAGKDGAKFGMIMPGTALLGARYMQEVAPEVAMDRAEVVSLDRKVTTPAGKFKEVLKIQESTPLEPGHIEYKYYVKGIGLIKDGPVKLVKHGKPDVTEDK
ncbi:MAG: hypothetical protein FD180_3329 [Planctomycetota bacterium]|nr:MAG: hypothetical protein FD180_3329 [Planctomycetota bacterium]